MNEWPGSTLFHYGLATTHDLLYKDFLLWIIGERLSFDPWDVSFKRLNIDKKMQSTT
jgi:hypothetical protein